MSLNSNPVLQYLGFYNGKIDGVFGWGTYWALRNFQYEFGMDNRWFSRTNNKEKLVKASNTMSNM